MIYITGDLHGTHDIFKLNTKNFPIQKELTRNDYLIICGDFGLVWDNSKEDLYWQKWLENKPFTTLWIDGNHENYDLLEEYPLEDWNGGKIQKIKEHIYHLCRGYVFEIDGTKIFTFGGAESHDKEYREIGISLWEEEMPSAAEMERGRQSLDKVNWNVDIVITHSMPSKIQQDIFGNDDFKTNALTDYFDEINEKLNFNLWFSGHYHINRSYDEKHHLIFNNIVMLEGNNFLPVLTIK